MNPANLMRSGSAPFGVTAQLVAAIPGDGPTEWICRPVAPSPVKRIRLSNRLYFRQFPENP